MYVYVCVRDNLENGWMDFYNSFFICSLWTLSNTWTTFFRKKWTDGRSVPQKRIFSYIKVYIYYKIQIVISVKIAHWTWQASASHCLRHEECYCYLNKGLLATAFKLIHTPWVKTENSTQRFKGTRYVWLIKLNRLLKCMFLNFNNRLIIYVKKLI